MLEVLKPCNIINVIVRLQVISCGIIHSLRIILAQEFADFCILARHLFTLSIPPTWRNGFMLSPGTSLHLMYINDDGGVCYSISGCGGLYISKAVASRRRGGTQVEAHVVRRQRTDSLRCRRNQRRQRHHPL